MRSRCASRNKGEICYSVHDDESEKGRSEMNKPGRKVNRNVIKGHIVKVVNEVDRDRAKEVGADAARKMRVQRCKTGALVRDGSARLWALLDVEGAESYQ